MVLLSFGNFYLGIDDVNYCDISIHIGKVHLEYGRPKSSNNGDRSMETGDRPTDVEITDSNWGIQGSW